MNEKMRRIIHHPYHYIVFLVCAVFAATCFFAFTVSYATNDDVFLNLISVGAFGDKYRQYLIYSNIILGLFLKYLNGLIPVINWYFWLMMLLNITAIAFICSYITKNLSSYRGLVITLIINIILAKDYYINPQFTQNALLYSCAGIIAIGFFAAGSELKDLVIGAAFIMIGAMVRFNCLVFMMPVLFIVVAVMLWWRKKTGQLSGREIRKILLSVSVIFICLAGIWTADRLAYSGEWRQFKQFNSYLDRIMNHTKINYDAHEDEYGQIGFSRNDASMFMNFMYADTEVFSNGTLKKVQDIENKDAKNVSLRIDREVIGETSRRVIMAFSESMIPPATLAIFIMILIFGDISSVFLILGLTFTGYAEYWYLVCTGRILWRVEIGVWLSLSIVALAFFINNGAFLPKNSNAERKKDIAVCMMLCVALTGIFLGYEDWFFRTYKNEVIVEYDSEEGLLRDIRRDREHVYVGNFFFPTPNCAVITRQRFKGLFENACFIGGWFMPSPMGLYYINEKGITNPVRYLVEGDNAYYYGGEDKAEMLEIFLNEHYRDEMGEIELVNIGDKFWKAGSVRKDRNGSEYK